MSAGALPEGGFAAALPARPVPSRGRPPHGDTQSGNTQSCEMRIERLTAAALADRLEELAVLRLAVLGEFPFLYSGSAAYEERYLSDLGNLSGGLILAAFERDRMIAAATGAPLDRELDALRDPFTHAGLDPRSIFYFGEVVVLPSHRGQGVGTALLEIGESHVRQADRFATSAFGEIVRSTDHPRRPKTYRMPDAAWRRLGYRLVPDIGGALSWCDAGDREETAKPLRFWIKSLIPSIGA
ncbi:N-acetyltransferase (plasmid) [Azospirillum humicireducens]|uniref:N-acetyltransferase n=2 Tax=Azospirillum humicireducens TaxID=1226968 RepID=A0A2R4VRJ2_9PROT|nr:N-acetyltransferase [Azospirillum humicireducens]